MQFTWLKEPSNCSLIHAERSCRSSESRAVLHTSNEPTLPLGECLGTKSMQPVGNGKPRPVSLCPGRVGMLEVFEARAVAAPFETAYCQSLQARLYACHA